jgi:hypothetical protein
MTREKQRAEQFLLNAKEKGHKELEKMEMDEQAKRRKEEDNYYFQSKRMHQEWYRNVLKKQVFLLIFYIY